MSLATDRLEIALRDTFRDENSMRKSAEKTELEITRLIADLNVKQDLLFRQLQHAEELKRSAETIRTAIEEIAAREKRIRLYGADPITPQT